MTINEITQKIIGAAYTVGNELGSGFLEKVYENAMMIELEKLGVKAKNQFPLKVYYKGIVVGDYLADLFVENSVIVELKSTKNTDGIHKVQLLNYLKASNKQVGLLINFGTPRVTVERIANGVEDTEDIKKIKT